MLAELQNISKYYEQPGSGIRNTILNQVSLAIAPKEAIAITGPSGSGKSTLLNILGTLDRPSSGQVILDKTRVDTLHENGLVNIRNRFIGFVFQMHHLLPQLTLAENVLLPAMPLKDITLREESIARAHRLLDRVGLKNHLHKYPLQMSVGECQRAAMVRALVNQPRLLLADEPTGSLDAANADQLGQLLIELNQENDLAIVVVTHSMKLAERMQKIYRLSSGEIQSDQP